jgi:hypothetical protein
VKLKGPGSPRISPISQTRDREFESISLQRGVTCELDLLDQGAELGYRVPDHGATRPHLIAHDPADAGPAGFSQGFEPGPSGTRSGHRATHRCFAPPSRAAL